MVLKGIFSETTYVILSPPPRPQNEPLKCPPRLVLKLRWRKHCVLSVAGTDNANSNNDNNNIIFIIKDRKLYVPVETLSAKDNKKLP